MKSIIKACIPQFIKDGYWKYKSEQAEKSLVASWIENGKPMPAPSSIKGEFILSLAKINDAKIFIESGTHKGQTVKRMQGHFEEIYSIELNDELYAFNVKQFSAFPEIKILHGDSGQVLADLLPTLNKKSLFWLDGHYDFTSITSKGELVTPIRKELKHISAHNKKHVVLIDDARLFDGTSDYPTIEEVKTMCLELFPNYDFSVELDMIILKEKLHEI